MFFGRKKKLLGYAEVKIEGVRFLIRKLAPSMFLENPHILPFSNVKGDVEMPKNVKDAADTVENYKSAVKEIILKGVVKPEIQTEKETANDKLNIKEIMQETNLYNQLFSAILMHTFGTLKKKHLFPLNIVKKPLIQSI